MIFKDRKHAGMLLATNLLKYQNDQPLILALPRGGAPLAAEIANRLGSPWNFLVVRKIGAPFHSELAIGAVCENDQAYFNERLLAQMGLQPDDVERIVQAEKREVQRQILKFRSGKQLGSLLNKTVIVVDDGLATGATMLAAIKYLKKRGVGKIVVATPVSSVSAATKIRSRADELVTIEEREDLLSVGSWYEDFSQVSDEEVLSLIKHSSREKQERLPQKEEVMIRDKSVQLKGDLTLVPHMKALIVFAHGSGSSRLSPRNQMVASSLNAAGFGTFLLDLLTQNEFEDRENVFDISLLSRRLSQAAHQLRSNPDLESVPFGFFGASTGAGAALVAAAHLASDDPPYAVVSRGGRVDLAGTSLRKVKAPTLLIVGEQDPGVLELNEEAQQELEQSELVIIPNATHLFEEQGALEQVAQEAAIWFTRQLPENTTRQRAMPEDNRSKSHSHSHTHRHS